MLDKKRLKEAKELFKISKNAKNKYAIVFNVLKEDIKKLKEVGLSYNAITDLLNKQLNTEIKVSTLANWYQRNCKMNTAKVTKKETNKRKSDETNSTTNDDDENKNAFAFLKTTK